VRRPTRDPFDPATFAGKQRAVPPHEFVLDAIASLEPTTRPMFGCLAVYVEDRIMLILRDRKTLTEDNGVWLATTIQHHESLQTEFPRMRSVQLFGKEVTDWQVIAADTPDFERSALRACALILAGDRRIGKVPKRKKKSALRQKG
jgi:hypothetical protein